MYVRCICHPLDWNVDDIEKIPNLAISDWSTRIDSDYSMFEIDALSNSKMLDRIAIYFFSQSPGQHSSFSLLPVTDELAQKLPKIIKDEPNTFGLRHVNVKGATYKDFKTCVDYTYRNQNTLIRYGKLKFHDVFASLSEKDMKEMLNILNPPKGRANLLKQIGSIFFRDSDKFQNLIKDYQ